MMVLESGVSSHAKARVCNTPMAKQIRFWRTRTHIHTSLGLRNPGVPSPLAMLTHTHTHSLSLSLSVSLSLTLSLSLSPHTVFFCAASVAMKCTAAFDLRVHMSQRGEAFHTCLEPSAEDHVRIRERRYKKSCNMG